MGLFKFLTWRRCAHTWVFSSIMDGKQQIKRRHCVFCGRVENVPLDYRATAGMGWVGSGGGGGGGSDDGCG
jgi:hypothetical protein